MSGFEYLSHPADIQVHSWGPTVARALEPQAVALFGEMMDLDKFEEKEERKISIQGSDILSMVYSFLDEWLYIFDTDCFVGKRFVISKCDLKTFEIEAIGYGEVFDQEKHASARKTEVKAITYAQLQVIQNDGKAEIYVILDL